MNVIIKKSRTIRAAPDSYLALILEQPLCAVRSKSDYQAASRMIDLLAVRDDLDEGEQQYLDAIEVLLEAYENRVAVVSRDARSPCERLKAAMHASGTTAAQLQLVLGSSQSMVSMILSGQRELSKKAIFKLARHFKLDPAYFL